MVAGSDNLAHERKMPSACGRATTCRFISGVQEGEKVMTSGGLGLDDKARSKSKALRHDEDDDDGTDKERMMTEDKNSAIPGSGHGITGRRGFRGPSSSSSSRSSAMGVYLAFNIPVAVFPSTDFPRIVVGIDNGVAPIDQMQVTVTRPIEEAMNSVPGLEAVRSTTSRGSAEVNLFFNWNVDMFQTLEYVNAALARVQPTLPSTAKLTANRLTFAAFPDPGLQPDFRHHAADRALGAGQLHHQAAAEPRQWRLDGGAAGRTGAGIPDGARSGEAAAGAGHGARRFWMRSRAAT